MGWSEDRFGIGCSENDGGANRIGQDQFCKDFKSCDSSRKRPLIRNGGCDSDREYLDWGFRNVAKSVTVAVTVAKKMSQL